MAIDFSKLLNRPFTPPPKVPGLSIGITGHRPDKLGGYEFGNPTRKRMRAEIWEATIKLMQDAKRDRYDASYRDNFLRQVKWQNGWEIDEKWRTIPVLGLQGGAQGTDQDAAAEWYRMELPYVLVAPFPKQDRVWPKPSQARFAKMSQFAAGIYLASDEEPTNREEASKALLHRNIVLCQMSDELIAVFDGSIGGTAHCVNWWNSVHHYSHFTRLDPREWRPRTEDDIAF